MRVIKDRHEVLGALLEEEYLELKEASDSVRRAIRSLCNGTSMNELVKRISKLSKKTMIVRSFYNPHHPNTDYELVYISKSLRKYTSKVESIR